MPFAVVPPGATTGPITVTSAEGSFTTADVFTVIPLGPPVVSSFQPTSGMPGTFVDFSGTNLVGIKSVLFNGMPAASIMGGARPDGYLEAAVPLGATTGPITVITDLGSYTTADIFIVVPLPKPVITGFVPESAAPGSWINIMGTNFLNVQSVAFSGVESPSFSNTPGGISAKVPFAAGGPITVVTQGGTAVSSNVFTVIGGPPPLSNLDFPPASGPTGTRVMINGASYGVSMNKTVSVKRSADRAVRAEARQLRRTGKRIAASRTTALRLLAATGMYTIRGELKPQFR